MVHPYTDGNRVTPIYNGADYMARAYELIRFMIDGEDPSACRLWLHAWRMEPVKVLGETVDGPDIVSLLEEAAHAGVQVRFLASGHDSGSSKLAKRIIAAGGQGARDRRTKTFGSHHQKFIVCRFADETWRAILGSGDFLYARSGTPKTAIPSNRIALPKERRPMTSGWRSTVRPSTMSPSILPSAGTIRTITGSRSRG